MLSIVNRFVAWGLATFDDELDGRGELLGTNKTQESCPDGQGLYMLRDNDT